MAFAGAGGGQNLVQSNWIRDKGFGMGDVRAAAGQPGDRRGGGRAEHGLHLRADAAEPGPVASWWKFANLEQLFTFVLITFVTIFLTSLLAYSTVYGRGASRRHRLHPGRGRGAQDTVGAWFGMLFWVIGAFSLFAAALGIVDYTSRLAADVLKTTSREASTRAGSTSPGLGLVVHRHPRPAGRHGPAAGAARHLRLRGRRDDVHLPGLLSTNRTICRGSCGSMESPAHAVMVVVRSSSYSGSSRSSR